jgi:hypothetical protein
VSDWAFLSRAWEELNLHEHELQTIHRQDEGLDQELMTALREWENVMSMPAPVFDHFMAVTTDVPFSPTKCTRFPAIVPLCLKADATNKSELGKIEQPMQWYNAIDRGKKIKKGGNEAGCEGVTRLGGGVMG